MKLKEIWLSTVTLIKGVEFLRFLDQWKTRWDKCADSQDDYFEKTKNKKQNPKKKKKSKKKIKVFKIFNFLS